MDAGLHTALIGGGSAVLVAIVSGFVTWFVARRQVKSQEVTASAHVQEAINSGFAVLTEKYVAREREQTEENEKLVGEVRSLRTQVDQLTGYVRELLQIQHGLVARLRSMGADVGEPPRQYGPPHPLANPMLGVVPPWPKEG